MVELVVERRDVAKLRPLEPRERITPIVWLNLVCLDAPIVAITWQSFFARSFHGSLPASSRAALFLTAWLIYLADRLADSWDLRQNGARSLRQQFCQRHQRSWIAIIAGIGLIDVWIISHRLDRATVRIGMTIGAICLVYLAVNYRLGKIWRLLPIKEICVGFLFALGSVAALLPGLYWSAHFVVIFLFFVSLCSLNCISIAVWERELDLEQHKSSIATSWPGVHRYVTLSAFSFALFAFIIAPGAKALAPLVYCIGASALLLAALYWSGENIPRDERTALADLVLLTPLFLYLLKIA